MAPHDAKKVRKQLEERRHTLVLRRKQQMNRTEEELDSREIAWEDLAAESSDAVLGDQLADADLRAAREIDAALARLDAGTYGSCAECGRPIDAARLAIHPAALLCADCAFASEKEVPAPGD